MSIVLCPLKWLHCFHLIKFFFQVVLSFWMERPKQRKEKNRILSCYFSAFMLEVAYVEVLSLNNLQFSGLRPCRRKMKIFKATLHKRSCYSGGNRTIWGSNCWEPWNFFSQAGKRWDFLREVLEAGRLNLVPKPSCAQSKYALTAKARKEHKVFKYARGEKNIHLLFICW